MYAYYESGKDTTIRAIHQEAALGTKAWGPRASEQSRYQPLSAEPPGNGKRKPQLPALKALATALDVPLADMFAMAGYVGPYDLPSVTPYLRARYGHLSEEALASANAYLERLIDEYGLDPSGPLPFEDETNQPAPH